MAKSAVAILLIIFINQNFHAQLNIITPDSVYTVNFDSSVTGVNNGEFTGSGFASVPVSGQIDSDGLIVTGMSDGDLYFGAAGNSADYTQGESDGAVTTGGVYAFRVSPQNKALGLQPTETDWTPGDIILKITNMTGGIINTFEIAYKIYLLNDQDRAGTLQFYYSTDNSIYHNTSALNFTSVQLKDESPAWSSFLMSIKISAELNDGEEMFLKWSGSDAAGTGSRDEIALDDIEVTAHYEDIKVIITEVADNSVSEEEYVEIFNGGSMDIDIEGWRLIERYNPNNIDSREIELCADNQKNTGGSGYLNLTKSEYAVIVRSDYNSLKSTYAVNDEVSIFENFRPPAMTGDERYMLVNAVGDVIDTFGAWDYNNDSSFRVSANNCYERINVIGDGRLEDNWAVTSNSVYNYTPGSGNISPLPVELAFFYARIKNDVVTLYWQTANEINNYGFEVERSSTLKGRSAGEGRSGWQTLGFVPGHGNSYSIKNYSFTDYPEKQGGYLYRIKQIDVNGGIDYSESVEVSFRIERLKIRLLQNYPNPFNPVTTIKFSLPAAEHATIIVYDLLGNKLANLFSDIVIPGRIYSLKFNGKNLPSGIYYYTIETSGGSISKKMIILK